MSNSVVDLLARLSQGNVTLGWGAVLSLGRDELNRLIKDQYIQGFDGLRFLLPFTDAFPVNDDNTERVELTGIVLGAPTLSFESATLNKAAMTLTMSIINGTYTYFREGVGVPPTVLTSFSITQEMGFNVSMQANLRQVRGEVDKHGIVSLDLNLGERVSCNLGGVPKIQELMGDYFMRYFAGDPAQQRHFVLGQLDLNQYNPLCPTRFALCVQRAPGAGNPQSENYGDGAVVMFMLVKSQVQEQVPGVPSEGSNFPYLIPDDRQADKAVYSASLIVNHELLTYVEEEQIDILKNLIFPNQDVFEQISRHEPHDLAIFGALKPATDALRIEPPVISLEANQTQQFVARRGDGAIVTPVQWTVSSPDYPTLVGTITDAGVYTASDQSKMRRQRLPLVVTASYRDSGQDKFASALVQERFESMAIAPLVQIKNGTDQTPIVIHATSLNGGRLDFEIVEPKLGARLVRIDANHQHYFPPPIVQAETIVVQKIQVVDSSGDQVQATIVLINKPVTLEVTPYYVAGLGPTDTVPFTQTNDQIDPSLLNWYVIGEGVLDEENSYAPPQSPESMIDVVVCELPSPGSGWPARYGYSIINLQPVEREYIPIRWEELYSFKLSAPGGLVQAYANGLQQIPILIEVITASIKFDGQEVLIPVSDVELSRMRLVEQGGGQVSFIDDLQEGIDYESLLPYAAHVRTNRFSLYSPNLPGRNVRLALPKPRNEGTRYRELYIHMAVQGNKTFYAEFQDDNGRLWRSNLVSSEEGKITVGGVMPPILESANYQLTRDRAFSGVGNDGPEFNDPFNYYLDSVDYWRLSYRRLNTYPVVFAQLSVEANVSSIQWESEFLQETFFSYTGYAFYPYVFRGSDAGPDSLTFDVDYRRLLKAVSPDATLDRELVVGKGPSRGELIVSLHRVADMSYWHDGMANGDNRKLFRALLDPSMIFVLLDQEGNRHRLQIGFDAVSVMDSRNVLKLNLQ